MGLKQIKDADRIIFLKEFTKCIILSLVEEEKREEGIEIEKLKKKFVEPYEPKEILKNAIRRQLLTPSKYSAAGSAEERRPIFYRERIPNVIQEKKIIQQRTQIPFKSGQVYKKPLKKINPQFNQILPQEKTALNISPMKKIEPLLKDSSILSIECTGPGKNLLVKRHNQINVTKIILNQQDINEIINEFSKEARIPLIGGILKAAVNNSVISAIVSEFVGSRFIINKLTPYSIINNTNK